MSPLIGWSVIDETRGRRRFREWLEQPNLVSAAISGELILYRIISGIVLVSTILHSTTYTRANVLRSQVALKDKLTTL